MTPRQVAAWAVLGFTRKRGEMAEQLAISAMAARDKPDSLNRQLKEWTDG